MTREEAIKEQTKMTYGEIYNKALCKLCLTCDEVEDYRPAVELYIPELKSEIPNAIIIWLKAGEKVIFIDKALKEQNE